MINKKYRWNNMDTNEVLEKKMIKNLANGRYI